jgi:hypothetical protein
MNATLWHAPPSVIKFIWDCFERTTNGTATQAERQALWRLAMHVRNGSPKGIELAEMFDRGAISGAELLERMK